MSSVTHSPAFLPPTRPSTGKSKYIFREPHSSRSGFLSRACLGKLSELGSEGLCRDMPEPFSLTLGFGPQEGWSQMGGPGAEMAQRDKRCGSDKEAEKCNKVIGWMGGGAQLSRPPQRKRE